MKIEIGESLFLSWLRHVKQCQIVQLNWKPSSSWELSNEDRIVELLQVFRSFIDSKCNRELFGKKEGQNHSQIIRQSEIDALGFELTGNKLSLAYAVDVAFHEGGLIYGDRTETVCRVVKKLVRASLVLLGYFGIDEGEVIFASPKISPSIYSELTDIIHETSTVARNNGLYFKFRLLGNDDFKEKVVLPVISLSREIADTSELFMRSIQLYNLFENSRVTSTSNVVSKTAVASNEIKIGQLVRTTFNRLFSEQLLDDNELYKLRDVTYSKKTFGLNYPILKEIQKDTLIDGQRTDAKGYLRYWSDTFGDGKYLICNYWYEKNRKPFIDWASKFDKSGG